MKAKLLYSKFWSDGFILKLNPYQRLIFLYYLTNECVNVIHLYEMPAEKLLYDTGLYKIEDGEKILEDTKKIIQTKGSMYFNGDFVYLANAEKYNTYRGVKNIVARKNEVKQLSEKIRAWYKDITGRDIEKMPPQEKHAEKRKPDFTPPKQPTKPPKVTASIDFLVNIEKTPDIIDKYAKKYKVSADFVIAEAQKIINYCKRNGRKYKDYGAVLDTFISGDLEKQTPKKAFTGENVGKYSGL